MWCLALCEVGVELRVGGWVLCIERRGRGRVRVRVRVRVLFSVVGAERKQREGGDKYVPESGGGRDVQSPESGSVVEEEGGCAWMFVCSGRCMYLSRRM